MDTTPVELAGAAAPRIRTSRHLALGSYWFGQFFVITPLYTVLLQWQVTQPGVVPHGSQATAIGLATGLGGFLALVVPPLVGAWSDGLTTRWGRRRPIMVAGTLGIAAALLVLFGSSTYPPILVGFVLAVAFINVAGAAYVAVIPDTVQGSETGRASGVLGFFVQLGSVVGLLATLFFARSGQGNIRYTYLALALVVVLTLLPTLWALAGEGTRPAPARERRSLREFLSPLWTGDFGWACLTRFLNLSGLWTTLPFLYIGFRDLLGLPNPDQFTSLFILLVTAAAVPVAIVCGSLSDRQGRKRFVYAASAIQAAVPLCFLVGSLLAPPVVLLLGIIYGLGYGAYSAVDWALGLDTLPDRDRPAKDLGLYHVADALPRVLLPTVMGVVLDAFNRVSPNLGYRVTFVIAAVLYASGGILVRRIRSVR